VRLLAAAPMLLVVATASSCGPACRDVAIEPLDLECEENGEFSGELHFDSAASFDTFVAQQCLPSASTDEVEAVVDSVDFGARGVFVAKGPNSASTERCIVERDAERAQVCEDGLKVYFRDRTTNDDPDCTGTWTTAFTLAREDLRAVLAIQ
jgi:hypothetical protein